MKRTIVTAAFLSLVSVTARAQDPHHPDNLDCSAQLNSGAVTPTITSSGSPSSRGVLAPAAVAASSIDLGCSGYTYVKVKGMYDTLTIKPVFAGVNVNTSAWDCNHTAMNYSVYNNVNGAYTKVGGGVLFGTLDASGTCIHDISSFASQ